MHQAQTPLEIAFCMQAITPRFPHDMGIRKWIPTVRIHFHNAPTARDFLRHPTTKARKFYFTSTHLH